MNRASSRWGLITFALIAVVGLAALVYAAANDVRPIAFSLDIPPTREVAAIEPSQSACEGPVPIAAAFGAIQIFLIPAGAPGPAFQLTVRDFDSGKLLAAGHLPSGYTTQIAPYIALDATVPSGRRVEVCLHNRGPTGAAPLGGPGSLTESVDGTLNPYNVSLVFARRHPRSLLSLVPTVFDRAALFHPRWVGAWTFWVLTGAVLAAFALGGLAIARAARGDARSSE